MHGKLTEKWVVSMDNGQITALIGSIAEVVFPMCEGVDIVNQVFAAKGDQRRHPDRPGARVHRYAAPGP